MVMDAADMKSMMSKVVQIMETCTLAIMDHKRKDTSTVIKEPCWPDDTVHLQEPPVINAAMKQD
eukprot:9607887-Ditylum_brightwellii.AAC.1